MYLKTNENARGRQSTNENTFTPTNHHICASPGAVATQQKLTSSATAIKAL
jgi:hypothetical protein